MLNKQTGNMYGFVNKTWNPIKGKCIHDCGYCYITKMNIRFNKKPLSSRLDKKCLKDNLGKDNFIFVGSGPDMWANNVFEEDIIKVLDYCKKFDNEYLFQSKNPDRIMKLRHHLPKKSIVATTIETNNNDHLIKYGTAILLHSRYSSMLVLKKDFITMITIEPIMDFHEVEFPALLKLINPDQINIGADSGHNKLPEPSKEKVHKLIQELHKAKIKIHLKTNLRRLL